MQQAEIIAILLMLMAALVVIAKKLEVPYPVMLVLGGLALSFVPRLPEVKPDPNVVFYFFLPALLYPTALFTSWRDFRRNLRAILLLAIGLVLITMVVVAWVVHTLIPSLPWAAAFALGAIVSPPDAVAATAVIRRLSVPHRIKAILESDSLVNDATALVALQFAVAAMMTGTFSLSHASLRFVLVGAGGIGFATPQYQQLQQQALSAERDAIIQLRNKHVINDEALRRIQRDLDLAEVRLFGG